MFVPDIKDFQPDYRHFLDVMRNTRPARLPLYEHSVSREIMQEILGVEMVSLIHGGTEDIAEYFSHYCRFYKEMRYDIVSFEVGAAAILPGHGALSGGKPGPIQSRRDFDDYPWDELPSLYRQLAAPRFAALIKALPEGMKAVGGVGNGVFEIAEDLVGLEYLPFMQMDEPELYGDLFVRIGDIMHALWSEFLDHCAEHFVACRFGDDLGFRSSLLTNPQTVRQHVLPQYRRIIDLIHSADKPFLWHSCGCIFEIMDEVIDLGIDAKHSNEDAIAPFDRWIAEYGKRIGLLGGFDMDMLCTRQSDQIYETVLADGRRFRDQAMGYALGSGNSIPDYVPTENYLAMVRAGHELQRH